MVGDLKTCGDLMMEMHELVDANFSLARSMVDEERRKNGDRDE